MKRVLFIIFILCIIAGDSYATVSNYSSSSNSPFVKKTIIGSSAAPILRGHRHCLPHMVHNHPHNPRLSKMEQQIFGRCFEGQDINSRLNRIERSMFNKTYSNSDSLHRIDNIYMNYNQVNSPQNLSRGILSRFEQDIFNQSFSNLSDEARLGQLEQRVLGTMQSGDKHTRFNNLRRAINNSKFGNSYYSSNYGYPYYAQNTSGGFWRNLLNSFTGGTPTGLSPMINSPDDFYINGGSSYNQAWRSNDGFYNFHDVTGGTRVQILD